MIGVYDYTVILTYMSLVCGMLGSLITLHGVGHPYLGIFFLMFCGLCDTFDGMVARSKKNRTEQEKAFGIQIDSMADLVAFGVLPGCIGIGLLHAGNRYALLPNLNPEQGPIRLYPILFFACVLFYVLAAMIRLAWFNVLEGESQQESAAKEKWYVGLPVTSAALIFPIIPLLDFLTARDITLLYFVVLGVTGVLFLGKFRIKKPGLRMIALMLGVGALEFALLLLVWIWYHF
ncbi:MAG: CDP-alcohol phosphatidyltransferase family protein [Lachnospiraceae bacterium]|nr:CDP-alcohol phosphatidyltransferase family protein [Lachnospiraceae bacterium]